MERKKSTVSEVLLWRDVDGLFLADCFGNKFGVAKVTFPEDIEHIAQDRDGAE